MKPHKKFNIILGTENGLTVTPARASKVIEVTHVFSLGDGVYSAEIGANSICLHDTNTLCYIEMGEMSTYCEF
ncbi:unnamed protein product [Echinostoma caproni]|uniref:WD_REPEATS_REGION domain-containing protein n=1 Tax=Echinostoma caproni TaxID=27848 RepID=A0A183A891_9TREM|nr:unnamed protein product [Echinostoma caproni]